MARKVPDGGLRRDGMRREPERGVGAVLRPCTASSTGSRRGSDVLVTIPDRPGAMVTRVGGGRSGGSTISTFFNNRVPLPLMQQAIMVARRY